MDLEIMIWTLPQQFWPTAVRVAPVRFSASAGCVGNVQSGTSILELGNQLHHLNLDMVGVQVDERVERPVDSPPALDRNLIQPSQL